MKVLVTGAAGFLGQALVRALLERTDAEVRLFVRPRSRALGDFGPRAEICEGNLTRREDARRAVRGADVVFHLAAAKTGPTSELFLNTVVASQRLLEAIEELERRPRVVLVSSMSVYGVASLSRGALIDESAPVEPHPELRDPYAFSKIRQEELFRGCETRLGLDLRVARPGVIYGPGGVGLPSRIGLELPGAFLHLGGDNPLPLTYVDNCADAIAVIGQSPIAGGKTFNIVDDALPRCREYLALFQREVRPLRVVSLPWLATRGLSAVLEAYHRHSRGQLPAVLTPYRSRALWGGNSFSNAALKSLGWTPRVPTGEGLRRTFASLALAGSKTGRTATGLYPPRAGGGRWPQDRSGPRTGS